MFYGWTGRTDPNTMSLKASRPWFGGSEMSMGESLLITAWSVAIGGGIGEQSYRGSIVGFDMKEPSPIYINQLSVRFKRR